MFFDLAGQVRVRVPGEAMRADLQSRMEAQQTAVFSTNGALSLDVAMTPVERHGEEFVLAIQCDLILRTPVLFAKLLAKLAVDATMLGMGGLVEQAVAAVEGMDAGLAGQVLAAGVEELPAFLAGTASDVGYTAYLVGGESWRARLRATVTPAGLLRHFALGAVLIGTAEGLVPVGASLGAALGAVLFPAGAPFVLTAMATRAVLWLGSTSVKIVTLKLPVWWKLARIGRLARRAASASGERRQRLARRLEEYRESVLQRVHGELDQALTQWNLLRTLLNWFRWKVKYSRTAGTPEGLDLAPYQPLIDSVARRLAAMAHAGDWYAGRFYYQLKDAVQQLESLDPEAPPPLGVWGGASAGPR
jgi:hypothetical protein